MRALVNSLYELAREKFLGGDLDWDAQTFKASLLRFTGTSDTAIRQIASSTNATPIVVTTAVSHGFATGDTVYISDHTTNTAANGLFKITAASAAVFSLTRYYDGTNVVGNGVGGATGYCVNLGQSAGTVGDFYDDVDGGANAVGLSAAFTTKTKAAGVADADDVTFTSVSGSAVEGVVVVRDTGTASTSELVCLITGKFLGVVAADAAISATTIWFDKPLPATVASQSVAFSNGITAAAVAGTAGNRFVTCTALGSAITAGNQGLVVLSGSGLPVTPNGGNIVVAFDSGANRIFKL
jgi:hypothetical protein